MKKTIKPHLCVQFHAEDREEHQQGQVGAHIDQGVVAQGYQGG